nr:hypothetical protein [Armatimonas sp.]
MSAPASLAAPKGAAPTLGKLLGVACDLCGTEDQLVLAGTLCTDGQWRTFRVCLACRAAWEICPGGLEVLVHEERAEYVLEPCPEPYVSRPPREVLDSLIRSHPGVWAVSVLWWSPPRLEVLLLSVTGQNRVFRGEVIGE